MSHRPPSARPDAFASSRDISGRAYVVLLTAVLLAGTWLRLYHLEVPSLWWDEALTAMMARYPLSYIVAWSTSLEVHPPFFYLLTKAFLQTGTSDFALRLPLVLFGLGHVLLCAHLLARHHSRLAGLAAAALLAACPLHILLSRQVRPYPILLCAAVLSILAFLRWLDRRDAASAGLLALANALLAAMHFEGVMLVGVEMLAAVAVVLARRPIRWRSLILLGALNALALAPTLYFFLKTTVGRADMLGAAAPLQVAGRLLLGVDSLFRAYVQNAPVDWVGDALDGRAVVTVCVVAVLCLAGFRSLWRSDRSLAVLLGLMTALPALGLAFGGQGFMRTRHLLPVYVPLVLFAAVGLARALRPGVVRAAGLCALILGLPVLVFSQKQADLYQVSSHAGYFKQEARVVAAQRAPGEVLAFSDYGQRNAVNWYLDQWTSPNPLRLAQITADQPRVAFSFLSGSRLDDLPKLERKLVADLGEPADLRMVYDLAALRWVWDRRPVQTVRALPERRVFAMSPRDFLVNVNAVRGAMLLPLDGLVTATANRAPGEVRYAFANATGRPARLRVDIRYGNVGLGNTLEVLAGSGQGPERVLFASHGIDPRQEARVFVPAPPDAATHVLYRLTTDVLTPNYAGENLLTNAVSGFAVGAWPPLDAPAGPEAVAFRGLGAQEGAPGGFYRWASGPETRLTFTCRQGGRLPLKLVCNAVFPGQRLDILLNGAPVLAGADIPRLERLIGWHTLEAVLDVREGDNELVLRLAKWNHRDPSDPEETFAPDEDRNLALLVKTLDLGDSAMVDD